MPYRPYYSTFVNNSCVRMVLSTYCTSTSRDLRLGWESRLNLGERKGRRIMAQASAASGDGGSGGTSLRVKVQRFGSFLSGMVMPNIGAFIAWGLITALFIPDGWLPNATLAALTPPMITYLLPLLMGTNKPRSCRRRFAQKVNVRRWLSMPG